MARRTSNLYMPYTKTDSKMTSSWKYKPKYDKPYNKKDFQYITNTKIKSKNKKVSPKSHTDAGITSLMRKKIMFNLNMTTGVGGYANNTATYFDRLYSVYPEHELGTLCQYVFIVRPDLNILSKNGSKLIDTSGSSIGPNSSPAKDEFFKHMHKYYPELLNNLSGNELSGHDFMPFLVGRTESLNLPDYTIKDYKINQPFTDYNLPYASHALSSQTGGQFEIVFREDDDLRIHKLFQTWLYYISGVTRNLFSPRNEYIRENRIDYACSIYCITCKADATTIVHWTKYTGAFPTSCPNSDLSFNLRGTPNNRVSISFNYFYQESLDPLILVDFNKNSQVVDNSSGKRAYVPVYRSETIEDLGMKDTRSKERKMITGKTTKFKKSAPISLGSGNGLVGAPFICKVGNRYELRWKPIKNLSPN